MIFGVALAASRWPRSQFIFGLC